MTLFLSTTARGNPCHIVDIWIAVLTLSIFSDTNKDFFSMKWWTQGKQPSIGLNTYYGTMALSILRAIQESWGTNIDLVSIHTKRLTLFFMFSLFCFTLSNSYAALYSIDVFAFYFLVILVCIRIYRWYTKVRVIIQVKYRTRVYTKVINK